MREYTFLDALCGFHFASSQAHICCQIVTENVVEVRLHVRSTDKFGCQRWKELWIYKQTYQQ